ncbi:hypothetical protein PHYBOEH_002203 [Phytophthora boehmeriae]|uniref:Uncharacterized protein n=1 Tax=Phytophthora boehmeriae TaxID=109152 RepID=A0A8T1WSQ6_9STRA|nr:hypothetical protein PHYBOEH_002203 [Phytophthora boehmeriae]
MASRGDVSSVKKASSTAEAPIWKTYLAVRSPNTIDVSNGRNALDSAGRSSFSAGKSGWKRAKSTTNRNAGTSIWMALATPLATRGSANGRGDGAAVLKSVRHYWEQLTVNERQQILFMDEPELVKQLYKLNLSLLCVGLMQRHLKTSNRSAITTTTGNKNGSVTATVVPKVMPSSAAPAVQERAAVPASTRAATDLSSEKTYELLEAMEFMDIGTGILTVKTELAEDTERLFSLVGDVLSGFLTSIHVLTESNFNKLFVAESETINTWANYQRLIGMLVEQLILKSYVSYLEKEAAQQMEQLLLEVSLEDKNAEHNTSTDASTSSRKKSKKKKKRRSIVFAVDQHDTSELGDKNDKADSMSENSSDRMNLSTSATVQHETKDMVEEPGHEPMPEPIIMSQDDSLQPNDPPEAVTLAAGTQCSDKDEAPSKRQSGLNPNASIFQPQHLAPATEFVEERNPYAGKRKFDEYIVSVPLEDIASDEDSIFESRSVDGDVSDDEFDEDSRERDHRRWRKQRRCEEDAELEWQLQQVYASTASLFGWDFSHQRELPPPNGALPWNDSTLWRTAPKEVVRYFSPGGGDSYSSFHASRFLHAPVPGSSIPPPSRYYFSPDHPAPFGPPLLPSPGMEQLHPSFHGGFGFPPEFPMVVSSPDFSNSQFHPINHHRDDPPGDPNHM